MFSIKKRARRLRCFFAAFCLMWAAGPAATAQDNVIVPAPMEIGFSEGVFPISGSVLGFAVDGVSEESLMLEKGQIAKEWQRAGGAVASAGSSATHTIKLTLDKSFSVPGNEAPDDEAYELRVGKSHVSIRAGTEAGLFYGVQSLKQLIRAYGNSGAIPSQEIKDWPDLAFRGVLDDISRGPVPTVAFVRHQIDRLSELKFNRLSYYSEHIIQTESHPEIAPPAGSISIPEWRALGAYARERHVMLVGNFQSFGHFEKSLAHPGVRALGEADRMISPVLPEAQDFLADILDEVIPAFDAPYFCINSDETFDLGKGYSKLAVDEKGLGNVYADHINWLHEQTTRHGVRMMLWADIVAKHPEIAHRIPQDTIMMPWDYSAEQDFKGMIAPLKDAGYDVIATAGILNSYRIIPNFEEVRHNLRNFIGAAVETDIMGSWTTVWDDGGMALFTHDWYGLAYAAEQNWHSTETIEKQDFERRLGAGVYGASGDGFVRALDTLYELNDLKPTQGFKDRILWRSAIPSRGETSRIDAAGWDDVLQRAVSARALLEDAQLGVYPEDADVFAFSSLLFETLAKTRLNALDAAAQYSLASRNQFQDPVLARGHLLQTLDLLSEVAGSWRQLHDRYESLWLYENHSYWLDHVLEKYQGHIAAWSDAHARVRVSLRDLDMGRAIAAPMNVRLSVEPLSGQYFMGWLELDAFPVGDTASALDTDYLTDSGGELASRPKVTETIVFGGRKYRWHRVLANAPDIVDLIDLNPSAPDETVIYEFAELTSPDERIAKAAVGSSGAMEIFVNGVSVYRHDDERSLVIDEDTIRLPLKAGKNYVMVKLVRHGGDMKFSFNLPDNKISAHKNRYRILD
ncbi:glycoside hydrolase family 20 zincin-like fold domain-containing protein [Kordiimonas sp.]|uniref:glycoside hydrolase family 20 zincin-like fold domain-containing protein n=1 Tax=Kordiimonas sp. TaxID=1970157 RepID=UPI003A8F2C1F